MAGWWQKLARRAPTINAAVRHHTEQAPDESEEYYRLLFERNPQPMWVFDTETLQFLAVNDAAVVHYGYSRDEFLRMTILDIRPAEDVPDLMHQLKHLPARGAMSHRRHRKKDGTLMEVEVHADTITFNGRPARLIVVADITERMRLEMQLRQAQKMEAVGQLAGGVAHDFNNVLTVIGSCCDFLMEDLPATARHREEVHEIRAAADRAAALTRQLLAFSRQQVLQPRILDLNTVLTELETMLARLIGADITIHKKLAADLGRVRADRGQIEQVIVNLIVNARDAMPMGGTLAIETSNVEVTSRLRGLDPGPYVVVSVRDTGCGMDAGTQARIFDPFFTTKAPGKGTGLGLSTVYGIVQQSGGTIELFSDVGRGSTFRVYLPRVADHTLEGDAVTARSGSGHGIETILVVEDEPAVRALTRRALQRSGYAVIEAHNGFEAIERCERHQGPIHLLLTDVIMPELSGPALATRIRQIRPSIRVIYMSGYTDGYIAEHGTDNGETNFLQKPISPSNLVQRVREVLDR